MASLNNEELLITFEELTQLETADIAACIERYQALKICEKSSAPAEDVYNLWVRKLFKAYETSEYTNQNWIEIIGFLEKLLDSFIQNVTSSKSDTKSKQLHQWWKDTHEFLQWLQTTIGHLEMHILCLILAFGFEIVIQTSRIAEKGNMQPLTVIHQNVLQILSKSIHKIEIQRSEDIHGLNKVLKSLCDVASAMSFADIKLSIETWRIVAKISSKCSEAPMELDIELKNLLNHLKRNSTEKPIFGITEELRKLFKYFQEDKSALNNDNFLKVAQFYLKLIKLISKNCPKLPMAAEYFEVYSMFIHHLKKDIKSNLLDAIQSDLNDILTMVDQTEIIEKHLCQHLIEDNKRFSSCDLVLEYLSISCKANKNYLPDTTLCKRIFDIVFEGPLFFVDCERFFKILIHFATLTAQDATCELHLQWCKHVVESKWIKSYTCCEILRIYYGYLFKNSDAHLSSCLLFWTKAWQRYKSYSNKENGNYQKYLIEMIIKTIAAYVPQNTIEQYFVNCPNKDIILLKCGVDNMRLLNHLNSKLTSYLKRIQNSMLLKREYNELLHLLDIWCRHEQFVMVGVVKDDLIKAFTHIFSLSSLEVNKFKIFIWKCFQIFKILNDTHLDRSVMKCLGENTNKTKVILGVYMLEYLLHKRPQSDSLLKSLQSPNLMKIQKFLETPKTCEINNLHIFKNVNNENNTPTANEYQEVHISKRPRVITDNSYAGDYKFILNEILEHSQKLTKSAVAFDDKDMELLYCIKHNIDKCLLK